MRYFVIWIALLVFTPAIAQQVPTPTPEQLQMLQSLPESQRAELLEQFGLDPNTITDANSLEFPDLTRPRDDEEEPDDTLRVVGNETIVIGFTFDDSDDEITERLDAAPALAALSGTRAYKLDAKGELLLPGVATIPLAGLDDEQIALRLSAEPALSVFEATAQILPLTPTGVDALDYFGYELFSDVPTTFAPATDVPVPAAYVMGPGDELRVQFFGKENATFTAVVTRDGDINLPEIGPVAVTGLTFTAARQEIIDRVSEQKIGVRASVTMGELRSIRIFVLGDVNRPGSYTVSGLSTMTNALFLSGGIKTSGTLRNVHLKRNGQLVGTLDLYDLLLRGNTRDDRRLLPGDVIFVPPVGVRVGVEGEVGRPAYYELESATTASEIVSLAGGMTPMAFPPSGRIERVTERGDRRIVNTDLSTEAGRSVRVRDGDVLRIFPVLDRLDDSVELLGHVRRPAQYQWSDGLRLTDLLPSPVLLKPQADLGYILIRREPADDARIEVLSADLNAALAAPESDANPLLKPRDQVIAFENGPTRGAALAEILEQIESQATDGSDVRRVSIGGRVQAEGAYPFESGMRISDLIRAGGGFTESAFLTEAELTRYLVGEDGVRRTTLINIDLAALLAGDTMADEYLMPHDYLAIKEIPEWRGQETVTIGGEVRFPGVYPIKRGESLASVINRAGGLTDLSFVDGSVFTREILKQREEEQIETLISRLEADLTALALQSAQTDGDMQQAFVFGQGLLSQLR
ncbi:MAG: SLBB domain-containing protein [Pseudomonadota bacterium]